MKISQLIDLLKQFPEDLNVCLSTFMVLDEDTDSGAVVDRPISAITHNIHQNKIRFTIRDSDEKLARNMEDSFRKI